MLYEVITREHVLPADHDGRLCARLRVRSMRYHARVPVIARVTVLLLALTCLACGRDRPPPPRGVLVVSQEQQASWVRNFNPLSIV